MDNPEVVQLLGEIRDLQRQHVENYKNALHNQEKSLEVQRAQVRRSLILFIILIALLAVFIAMLFLPHH